MGYQLGVDIGTTHTAAAVLRSGRAEIVPLEGDSGVIPSVVFLETDGTVVVGEAASEQGYADPTRVARSFKRRMGDSSSVVALGGTTYSGGELMAKVLRRVVDIVSEREGGAPELVTVAHPAAWGTDRAELVSQVIELAGLDGARRISDPEAVAIHHDSTHETPEGEVVLVYDLGGGTFDVSLARKTPDGVEIVGTAEGIDHVGGLDFDEAVLDHISAKVGIDRDELDLDDPSTAADLDRLRRECAAVKEALSTATEVSVPVFLPGGESEIQVTRDDLEAMIRPAITETIQVLRRMLDAAAVEPEDVDAVVLVGGSSRIPLVAAMVSEELDRPVTVGDEPEAAVALGAALSMIPKADEHADDAEGSPVDAKDGDGDDADDADDPGDGPAKTEVVAEVATSTSGEADAGRVKEKAPKRPPPPPMSLLTSIAAVLACLAMIGAGVGAGTLIATGEVGIGIALIVTGVAACVALVLMLRKPSGGSSA